MAIPGNPVVARARGSAVASLIMLGLAVSLAACASPAPAAKLAVASATKRINSFCPGAAS
jgi:hypothetical protein